MKQNTGNALFLILIAVALFAALSYAVTNSGRGGGGIDRETAEINAAQLMNVSAQLKAAYQRLKIIGDYDQIQMTYTAENPSGTCYNGSTTYTCRNIGILNADTGYQAPSLDALRQGVPVNNFAMSWVFSRIVLSSGDEVGSISPDVFVTFRNLPDPTCQALNRRIIGLDSIPASVTLTGDSLGYTANFLLVDDTVSGFNAGSSQYFEVSDKEGCFLDDSTSENHYFVVLEEN